MSNQPPISAVRELKEGPLEVVGYEIRMWRYARTKLDIVTHPIEFNGWLECFLLHHRNLIDFLSLPTSKVRTAPAADIALRCPNTWAGKDIPADEIEPIAMAAQTAFYARRNRAGLGDCSMTEEVSRFLCHCTDWREKHSGFEWPYLEMFAELETHIAAFRELAAKHGLVWRDKFRCELDNATAVTIATGMTSTASQSLNVTQVEFPPSNVPSHPTVIKSSNQ